MANLTDDNWQQTSKISVQMSPIGTFKIISPLLGNPLQCRIAGLSPMPRRLAFREKHGSCELDNDPILHSARPFYWVVYGAEVNNLMSRDSKKFSTFLLIYSFLLSKWTIFISLLKWFFRRTLILHLLSTSNVSSLCLRNRTTCPWKSRKISCFLNGNFERFPIAKFFQNKLSTFLTNKSTTPSPLDWFAIHMPKAFMP